MINSLWNQCVKVAEKAFLKSNIYKRFFNKTDESVFILSDIAHFCGAYDIDLKRTKHGTIDPLDLARRAGKMEVYQYIFKLLTMDEMQKNIIAERYYQIQTKYQQENFK